MHTNEREHWQKGDRSLVHPPVPLAWTLCLCMVRSISYLAFRSTLQIHKPPNTSPSTIGSSQICSRRGWSRNPMDLGIPSENYGGAARLDGGRKFSPVVGGGYNWWDSGGYNLKTNKDEVKKLDLSLKL
ncbi:zinc finger protein 4 [Actinidia rufa]|uniref:Zinc finger protein 4 n=1 Tax=Actinidia rufa TaxID=165716 RepID=A0A7J0GAW9_9ERIC|nr:zinc finger protein 4 [Actinidia rufa]